MNILTVCNFGVNRSVTLASMLKFWGNDTLAVGLSTSSPSTLNLLCTWADIIILTEERQRPGIPAEFHDKLMLFEVGPDIYPRPFNPYLQQRLAACMEQHRATLKQPVGWLNNPDYA